MTTTTLARLDDSLPVLQQLEHPDFVAQIGQTLPQHVDAQSFVRHASTLIAQNDDLAKIAAGGPSTDPMSIVRGVNRAAALGLDLDPTLGQAWLVPRPVRGVLTAVFQPGYKGLLELVMRTGSVKRIEVERVYTNDTFRMTKGTRAEVIFEPDWFGDRGELRGWFALAELKSGEIQTVAMSVAQMRDHRDKHAPRAGGKNGNIVGPWRDNFDEMADKTIFIKLARWLPKSIELTDALSDDPGARTLVANMADTNPAPHTSAPVIEIDERPANVTPDGELVDVPAVTDTEQPAAVTEPVEPPVEVPPAPQPPAAAEDSAPGTLAPLDADTIKATLTAAGLKQSTAVQEAQNIAESLGVPEIPGSIAQIAKHPSAQFQQRFEQWLLSLGNQ